MTRMVDVPREDSAGEINCPRKGVLGIQRCHEYQADTERAGRSCVCPVFRAYEGGLPAEGACGENVQRCGSPSDPFGFNRFAVTHTQEPPQMATRPRAGAPCTLCHKPSPEDSRLREGLCKPCRAAYIRDAAEERKRERIASQHGAPSADVAGPAIASDNGAAVPAHLVLTKPQQVVFPAVAEQEVKRLKGVVHERETRIRALVERFDRISWVAHGAEKGFATLADLVRVVRECYPAIPAAELGPDPDAGL